MAALAKVLILGREKLEMAARADVLENFWAVQTMAVHEGDELDLVTDLVVVCDSLPEGERQDLVERVRSEAPQMLVVKMNGYDSGPHASADATVDEAHGPGALVSTIYALLTERGLPSRMWPVAGEHRVVH